MPEAVQDALISVALNLQDKGPVLGRPYVDTPYVDTPEGSKYPNMKEMRFDADDGVWRVAFAFDPERQAILLVAGDKAGVAQKRFYKKLIAKADQRFADHLAKLKGK